MGSSDNIKIRLVFGSSEKPLLLDVTSMLYDLELLHDFALFLLDLDYGQYKFSQYFWYRKGRPIKKDQQIRVHRIAKESPLTLDLIFSNAILLVPVFWLLVQTFEKIGNFRLNREKLRLEIEKLKKEQVLPYFKEEIAKVELSRALDRRDASAIYLNLLRRIKDNQLMLEDLDIIGYENGEGEVYDPDTWGDPKS